jgi:hypothetical protein
MQFKILIALTLFGSAFADLKTIQGAFGNIMKSVTDLDTSIKAINGAQDAQNVLAKSDAVQKALTAGTQQVMATDALDLNDALSLQQTGTDLSGQVKTTITDLIAKKPQIQQAGQAQQTVQALQQQKQASAAFGNAVTSKVPALGQSVASDTLGQINTSFDMGIQAFSQ